MSRNERAQDRSNSCVANYKRPERFAHHLSYDENDPTTATLGRNTIEGALSSLNISQPVLSDSRPELMKATSKAKRSSRALIPAAKVNKKEKAKIVADTPQHKRNNSSYIFLKQRRTRRTDDSPPKTHSS